MPTSFEVVIPVLNEESVLATNTLKLYKFLARELSHYNWSILIADNGSTDTTPIIANSLSEKYERIVHMRIDKRGRGRAVSTAWLRSNAHILAYMDVDLSTDLKALPRLVSVIEDGRADLAVASRLTRGAKVIGRPLQREFISQAYSRLVRAIFTMGIRDYQCGFKVISRETASELVPLVKDKGWFFDSELIILAHKNGYKVNEIPVTWIDDPDSRVKIIPTALRDLLGLLRLRFGGLRKASRNLRPSS